VEGVKQRKVLYNMSTLYWWSRFGDFSPGEGVLPHMGEVISHYRRKRGYRTQADFAIAAGVALRTIQEWETSMMMTHDHERRILLAKMLRIPPALLGLDWRLIFYEDNTGKYTDPSEHLAEIVGEDSYYHYEDTLIMGWECLHKGGLPHAGDRFQRRLRKLNTLVKNAPVWEREAWLTLLCQYYQLSSAMNEHSMKKINLTDDITTALQIATELDDKELIAACHVHLAHIYLGQQQHQLAEANAQVAMGYLDQLQAPSKGNAYLISATIHAQFSASDGTEEKLVRQWQDKALNLVYKGKLEDDRTFLMLNMAGVHHERAKTLLQFYQFHPNKQTLKDAHNEMNIAWKSLSPDLVEWNMYFHVTEARLYAAERDLEGSAQSGSAALKTARMLQSKKGEKQIRALYKDLNQIDEINPYVRNLGLELGIY
jgi:transcriptional regulator with XRE-family HTH domain